MKDMLIVVPIMGRLAETKTYWGCLLNMTTGPTDLMVIDNAWDCGDGQEEFFAKYIEPHWPGEFMYRPQDDNLGVVQSMQYAYENTNHSILAYLHNDIYIYREGWDIEVKQAFSELEKPGLIGFFGAEGVHPGSGRFNVWSNMLEAEIHGWRSKDIKEVAVLDGLCMIASREMLDVRGGLDTSFNIHHFYDLDLSLESLDRGYKNYTLSIPCHHQSGVTACGPLFQEWANKYMGMEKEGERTIYTENHLRFMGKWAKRLPYSIQKGWANNG